MSKSNNEVVVVVPMVIIQALQLDDESVCDHYRIKRLSGNQYLFGAYGLSEALIDAGDRSGYADDSLLSPEEFDIWAGMVIDSMKVLREHHNAALQARRDNGEWIPRERFL